MLGWEGEWGGVWGRLEDRLKAMSKGKLIITKAIRLS